jgi:hypothetical protein
MHGYLAVAGISAKGPVRTRRAAAIGMNRTMLTRVPGTSRLQVTPIGLGFAVVGRPGYLGGERRVTKLRYYRIVIRYLSGGI